MKRALTFLLIGLLAVAVPAVSAGGDPPELDPEAELIASLESESRYPPSAADEEGVDVEIYDDPEVISKTCSGAADPLDCTAEEGAAVIQADTDADAASAEQTMDDGSVTATSDYDLQEALETPDTPVDSPSTTDPSTPLDPPATPSEAIDMSLGEAEITVRPMERAFNTRQEVDYVGNQRVFDAAFDKIAGTHVRAHRLFVYWWDVQCRGSRTWSWTRYDEVVRAAHARGIRLILTPVGSPNWARVWWRRTRTVSGNRCRPAVQPLGVFAHPDNLNAWTVFIRRLVGRYEQYNPIGYEIWNEENARAFWDATGERDPRTLRPPNASVWARLYCLAIVHIDQDDPGTQVGVGGLAPYARNVYDPGTRRLRNMRASAFLQQAYRAQRTRCAAKPFDYVGYHPYIFTRYFKGRNPRVGDTQEIVELRTLRGVMRQNNQRLRKVWNTEWGFPSEFGEIDEPRQRELILREHNYLANAHERYSNNRRVYYMRFSALFNPIDAPSDDVWSHIGLVWIKRSDPGNPELWREKLSYALWAGLPQP